MEVEGQSGEALLLTVAALGLRAESLVHVYALWTPLARAQNQHSYCPHWVVFPPFQVGVAGKLSSSPR